MDRLSREHAYDVTTEILGPICNAGITIVTLKPEREYSRDLMRANPMLLMEIIFSATRAHEESARKSDLHSANWRAKRAAAAASSKPMSNACPAWMKINETRTAFVLIPERVEIVREIFDRHLAGQGQDSIAVRLNAREEPTWGTGIGNFEEHKEHSEVYQGK